jgi:hypothetical protein
LVLMMAVSTSPALACRSSHNRTPLIHRSVPALEDGEIAARVEIVSNDYESKRRIEARVLAPLKGGFGQRTIVLSPSAFSSCDRIPRVGEIGIVVGRAVSVTSTALTVDPRRGISDEEQRLFDSLAVPVDR